MKRVIFCLLAGALLCQNLLAQRWAVVEFSTNMMREEPDYTAEMGDQLLMGTVVEIVDESSYWKRVISPEPYNAWVNEMGLVEMSETEKNAWLEAPKYICTADYTHIWSEPSENSTRVTDLVAGCIFRKCIDGQSRPIAKKGFLKVQLPSGKTGWARKCCVEDFASWTASRAETADNILNTAYRFLGVPYMWGGTSIKAVDCSGFARSVYFLNGILLPRNASQQAKVGEDIVPDEEHLEAGDLIFFGKPAEEGKPERITHVGIYIGEGMYIHSAQVVRINSMDPESDEYSGRRPIRARRIMNNPDVKRIASSPYYFK